MVIGVFKCTQVEREYSGHGTHYRCSFKELVDENVEPSFSIDVHVQIGSLLPVVGEIYSLAYDRDVIK